MVLSGWAAGLFKEEHWVTLIRARAIENTVWVAAADQVPDPAEPATRAPTGVGRSMLIDPMGTVRLDLGYRPGVAVGEVDTELTAEVRTILPCLEHRRDDLFGVRSRRRRVPGAAARRGRHARAAGPGWTSRAPACAAADAAGAVARRGVGRSDRRPAPPADRDTATATTTITATAIASPAPTLRSMAA